MFGNPYICGCCMQTGLIILRWFIFYESWTSVPNLFHIVCLSAVLLTISIFPRSKHDWFDSTDLPVWELTFPRSKHDSFLWISYFQSSFICRITLSMKLTLFCLFIPLSHQLSTYCPSFKHSLYVYLLSIQFWGSVTWPYLLSIQYWGSATFLSTQYSVLR